MEDRKATVIRGIERILKNEQPKKEALFHEEATQIGAREM